MPLYQYKCNRCQNGFEVRHSYRALGTKCVLCESEDIQRVLASPPQRSIVIKDIRKKTGAEVTRAIEEARSEIERVKEQKSQRVRKEVKK